MENAGAAQVARGARRSRRRHVRRKNAFESRHIHGQFCGLKAALLSSAPILLWEFGSAEQISDGPAIIHDRVRAAGEVVDRGVFPVNAEAVVERCQKISGAARALGGIFAALVARADDAAARDAAARDAAARDAAAGLWRYFTTYPLVSAMVCSPGADLSVARSSTSSAVSDLAATSNGLSPLMSQGNVSFCACAWAVSPVSHASSRGSPARVKTWAPSVRCGVGPWSACPVARAVTVWTWIQPKSGS